MNWVEYSKHETMYDLYGNKTMEADFNWDPNINDWTGYQKNEYAWDTSSNQIGVSYYSWDPLTEKWIGMNKYEMSYDLYGNQILSVESLWNPDLNDWINQARHEYSYDSTGKQTLYAEYGWDPGESEWHGQLKEESTYDADGNLLSFARYACYDTYNNTWIMSMEEFYYRSDHETFPLNEKKIIKQPVNIFPNPFSDFTTVALPSEEIINSIELFDMSGRKVRIFENIPVSSFTLYRDNLPSGIYLLRIYTNKACSARVVVE
jgi:hypothetical protein